MLKVGAAKACISPTPDLFPFTTFGDADKRTELHDDLYTRAIVMDNGTTRAAIVNFDLVSVPDAESTKAMLAEAGGIPVENIMICATHNHDAPHFGGMPPGTTAPEREIEQSKKFLEIILAGAKQAVIDAVSKLRPAKYGYGKGESWINVSRDKQFEDGYWMQGNNYSRYCDKTLAVIKFVDEEGKLIAAMLNYPCHAVLGFVAKDFDGKIKVSSDWPGYAQNYAERRFGNDAIVLWTAGAEGNVNPVIGAGVYTYLDDGYAIHKNMPDGSAYVLMESLGGEFAIDAIRVINGTHADRTEMPIQNVRTWVDLPSQKAPEGADMGLNRMLADNLLPLGPNGEHPEKHLVEMLDDPEHPYPIEMSLLTLGGIALVSVPLEIYCEIGRDMKAASPWNETIVFTHTDSRFRSYVPDKTSKGHHVFQSFGNV